MMDQHFLLEDLKSFLSAAPFSWAVCGGFALDLFLNRTVREHGDMDLCVFETDRDAILRYVRSADWQIYEFRGMGKVRPLGPGTAGEPGRNLMCLRDGCDLVKFYPCEDEGLFYHEFFHTGLREFHYLEFIFSDAAAGQLVVNQEAGLRRELTAAILCRDGLPYLAPEVALLYKASNWEDPAYQLDYAAVSPYLSVEQQTWFRTGLARLYPDGHPWAENE